MEIAREGPAPPRPLGTLPAGDPTVPSYAGAGDRFARVGGHAPDVGAARGANGL